MNIFCTTRRMIVKVPFYRLNLADEYNNKMGRVDVGDQLRNYYRFDHFMRKRKWWWSFWMWGMGMLLTNTYTYELHNMKPKYNHYEFVCNVARAWLQPENYFNQDGIVAATSSTTATKDSTVSPPPRKRKAPTEVPTIIKWNIGITDTTLETQFKHRLDSHLDHLPSESNLKTHARCQLHSWATSSRMRKKANVYLCKTCNVHLCIDCSRDFHTLHDIVSHKSYIEARYIKTLNEKKQTTSNK